MSDAYLRRAYTHKIKNYYFSYLYYFNTYTYFIIYNLKIMTTERKIYRNRIGNILLGIVIILFSYWLFTNKINDINIKDDLKEENKKLDSANIRMEIKKEQLKDERNDLKKEIEEIKKEEKNEKIQIDKQTDSVSVSYFLDYINEYKRAG